MSKKRLSKEMRNIDKLLKINGYREARCRGSHHTYINRNTHRIVTVNNKLNEMVEERLIKMYGLREAD